MTLHGCPEALWASILFLMCSAVLKRESESERRLSLCVAMTKCYL